MTASKVVLLAAGLAMVLLIGLLVRFVRAPSGVHGAAPPPCPLSQTQLTASLSPGSATDPSTELSVKNAGTTLVRHLRYYVQGRLSSQMAVNYPYRAPRTASWHESRLFPGQDLRAPLGRILGWTSAPSSPLAELYVYYIYLNGDDRPVEGEQAFAYRSDFSPPAFTALAVDDVAQHDAVQAYARALTGAAQFVARHCPRRHS